MSSRKNMSSSVSNTLQSDETEVVKSVTDSLFDRKQKLGVLLEVRNSPFVRKSFKDDEQGFERFLSYHSQTHGKDASPEARQINK
jgi:hypothetical protein